MSEDAKLDDFVSGDQSNKQLDTEIEVKTSLDQTSVGNIPPGWSTARLQELTKNTLYGANESAEEYDPEKPRYIRIKDIDERGILKNEEKASLSRDKAEGYFLQKGDLLFARSGSPGRTYLHRHNNGEYCYGGYSIKHELVSEGLNHEYLSQYTKSQKYWDWIERIARTGAQANINSREYGSLLVPLPPLSEQRKIATVLYTVDRAIEKTEEIIDQTERVRRGYIKQQVLALNSDCDRQEGIVGTRRVSIPGSWETVRLGDVARIVSGKSFPRDYQKGHAGSRAIIKVDDMNLPGNDKYIQEVTNRVTSEVLDELNKNIFPENTVIHPRVGEALLLNKTRITGEDAAFDDNIMGWVPEGINPEYLYYASTLIDFNAVAQTGTVPSINKEMAANFRFPLPPEEEQKRIAGDISRVDGQISIYEEEKTRLKRLKRGLMQDLLSGTVRTTDTNIEVPDEIAQYG